ncbi:hypothetical protein [Oligosphaera ethanolica]|uniref:UDP-N-acetylmuramoyl-tripeptide--D-alanyl-D-alanine ligase n=1 Tax=Oligosphaera ethanolica TaxID=760260 RepID=A0AAE3VH30_9BACT|nr:hypothetical protein [Oligosphaera ethanolica]MDQ0290373.1 UDP-N-acetylmuramoyl-tripeptide--D-alanyl-D-alanine ligase [Oligosphaera ethanolica]
MRKIIAVLAMAVTLASNADANDQATTSTSLIEQLRPFCSEQTWLDLQKPPPISKQIVTQSIEAARTYYLNQQKTEGNFTYALDISTGDVFEDDNAVRQAGALWGLACLNRDRFNEPTRRAVILGLDFFAKQTRALPSGEAATVYGEDETISTGMVALYCLSIIDFITGQEKFLPEDVLKRFRLQLDIHLHYLRSMEMADGSWARVYDVPSGYREPVASAYYDGECLLAYCKAARYLGKTELIPRINDALPKLIKRYTLDCWQPGGDRELSKGFYQWGCMACNEYQQAGWEPHADLARHSAIALSWWLLHENQLASRQGNTSYAIEGLIAAWHCAKALNDQSAMTSIRRNCEDIMANLISWQYGGPLMQHNPYLSTLERVPPKAFGGITSSRDSSVVRIDIVQHQVHAMLMMLNAFYQE